MNNKNVVTGKRRSANSKKDSGRRSAGAEAATLLDGSTVPAAELAHIAQDLWPLVLSIDTLKPDPRDAGTHGAQNLDARATKKPTPGDDVLRAHG
jgi:hypothetical protein